MLMSYGYKEPFFGVLPFHVLDMFYKGYCLAVIKKIIYVIASYVSALALLSYQPYSFFR